MSNVKDTGFKKMSCGDLHHQEKSMLSDVGAGFVDLQIVGTDINISGTKLGSSITVVTGDYRPGNDADGNACTNPDGTFLITIESDAATYFVTLADGSDFIITPVQSTAYLGQWYPARLWSVNIGTTGNFCVGY
jgi:hypothetical protein